MRFKIFISSVQKEFKNERKALKEYINSDALLRRFFEIFIFEDLPASDRRSDEVYLDEVKSSNVYIGLFGDEYGVEDKEGMSPTHKKFFLATKLGKQRLIFIKGANDSNKNSKMLSLIKLSGDQLIRRRFNTYPELQTAVYASLVNYLLEAGKIAVGPFDATACQKAKLSDISEEKIRWFVSRARNSRHYALAEKTPVADVLTQLDLLDHGKPNHAAILLFGSKPQRFLISSEVKCMHFHTLEKGKPIPSYQIYKGTLFDLVDQAVDFVLSKLNRSVGTRAKGPQAPVEYDIPEEVVAEGIVNAIAHRDYASTASVEVQLFPDRLEIWNPGTIHPPLTLEKLLLPHASQPNNPLIADPLFLTKYIEKAGSGTVDMITRCRRAGIREPEFKIDGGFFVLILWRKKAKVNYKQAPSRHQVGTKSATQSPTQSNDPVSRLLNVLLSGEMSSSQLRERLNIKHRPTFRANYLHPALNKNLIEMLRYIKGAIK